MEDKADFYASYAENNLQDVIWGKEKGNWCRWYSLDERTKDKETPETQKDTGGLFDNIPF